MRTQSLVLCIEFLDLTNVINEPTRMGAILDPVIVSNIDIVVDSEVIGFDRSISDHNAVRINILCENV
jgi:hypothetical protein